MNPNCPACGHALDWAGHQTVDELSVFDGSMVPTRRVADGLEWVCGECERFWRPSEVESAPAEEADEVKHG